LVCPAPAFAGFAAAVVLDDFTSFAAGTTGQAPLPAIRFTGDGSRSIEAVAVLPGSGASLIDEAAAAGVGVLVTGDVKYHDADRAGGEAERAVGETLNHSRLKHIEH